MRILMISDVYFPRVNGVSTSIQVFCRELISQGHHVTLIAPDYGTGEVDELFNIIRIPSRKVMFDPEDRMMKWRAIFEYLPYLHEGRFDLVHIQTPFIAHYAGLKLAKELGVPTVETYHTFFEEYLYNYISFLPRSWLKFVARRFSSSQCNSVNAVVVPSSPIAKALTEYGVTNQLKIIPTGLQLSRFEGGNGNRFRQEQGIDLDRPVMVHVGRVAHEKNIDFLIDVVTEVRKSIGNILLVIAGEGPAVKHLKQRVVKQKVGQHVQFVGYLDRETSLLDCYRAGNVFVFSSRTETQGLVLLEAMALGVPVVSTAVLGTKDVLREGEGAYIASDDVVSFSRRVIEVLADDAVAAELSRAGPRYVQQWQASVKASEMIRFYEDIVSVRCQTVTEHSP